MWYFFIVVATGLWGLMPGYARADIRAGEWQITSSVTMNGAPIAGTDTKQKICLDQKKMEAYLHKVTDGMKRNGEKCELLNSELTSTAYHWQMHCAGMMGLPGEVAGKGDFSISAAKVEGDMTFSSKVLYTNLLSFTINNHFVARHIGACPEPNSTQKNH